MLTKTTVMKFLLRIQLVEIQLLEPPSSQQIPLPPLLEMLSDLSPTLGKLLPDDGEWWWWEYWWYLIWGWSWWCYLWWWFLCQSNTAINQMCSPQSIHDQRWNKVLCCHPSSLHVWTTGKSPAPSLKEVFEKESVITSSPSLLREILTSLTCSWENHSSLSSCISCIHKPQTQNKNDQNT